MWFDSTIAMATIQKSEMIKTASKGLVHLKQGGLKAARRVCVHLMSQELEATGAKMNTMDEFSQLGQCQALTMVPVSFFFLSFVNKLPLVP